MELREYQVRVLDQLWAALQTKRNVLMTAPCSAGKTVVFSKIIQRLLRENPPFKCMVLVDREILVSQSAEKLRIIAPELENHIGIACASVSAVKDTGKAVTFASRQTLIRSKQNIPRVELCIVDEAHLMALPQEDNLTPDQFAKILVQLWNHNPNMRLLGCTASPFRLGKTGGYIYGDRNNAAAQPYWDMVDAQITTLELLGGGYIAPLIGRVSVDSDMESDLSGVKLIAGEFNLGQLSEVMCREIHINSCVDAWRQYASDRKKTLVFCTTISHAEAVARAFVAAGIDSCAIHSKLSSDEQSERMGWLESGQKQVFTSVAKLTTGMDVVDIDCIIMARPTKSTALYQQCIGRGQRLAPGKDNCLIIDLVGCTKEFGVDMDNLKVNLPKDVTDVEAPMKICPGNKPDGTLCGQSVHAGLQYCPFCGYEFPGSVVKEAEVGAMKEIVFAAKEPPSTYDVLDVEYYTHVSQKTGNELIKVVYHCGVFIKISEFICLPDYYSGYAVTKAQDWWAKRSDEIFPETCAEFIFLSDTILKPKTITVVKEGKFYRVIDCTLKSPEDEIEDMLEPFTPEMPVYDEEDLPF